MVQTPSPCDSLLSSQVKAAPAPLEPIPNTPLSQSLENCYLKLRPSTDGLDEELIEAACLDMPLANGWTVKPHQKVRKWQGAKADGYDATQTPPP